MEIYGVLAFWWNLAEFAYELIGIVPYDCLAYGVINRVISWEFFVWVGIGGAFAW